MTCPPKYHPIKFSFCEVAPGQWGKSLDEFKDKGAEFVRTSIYWGAHEKSPGVRDFTGSSKLQLEKYLNMLSERNLGVELVLGFPPGKATFPQWVLQSENRVCIPRAVWDSSSDCYVLCEIPAWQKRDFEESFLGFLDETFRLVSLYQSPDGPVRKIKLDFGVYEVQLDTFAQGVFVDRMRGRYADIRNLNRCYGTNFVDFDSLQREKAFNLMVEKRPWLAAYDYKWCRRQPLQLLWNEVLALASAQSIRQILQCSLFDRRVCGEQAAWSIAFDSISVEPVVDGGIMPLLFEGRAVPEAVAAYRLFDFIVEKNRGKGIPCLCLPEWQVARNLPTRFLAVLSGRFLPRVSMESLFQHVKSGGRVFFPMGLARYDENVEAYDWPSSVKPVAVSDSGETFLETDVGEGRIWVPTTSWKYDESMWEKIHEFMERVTTCQQNQ